MLWDATAFERRVVRLRRPSHKDKATCVLASLALMALLGACGRATHPAAGSHLLTATEPAIAAKDAAPTLLNPPTMGDADWLPIIRLTGGLGGVTADQIVPIGGPSSMDLEAAVYLEQGTVRCAFVVGPDPVGQRNMDCTGIDELTSSGMFFPTNINEQPLFLYFTTGSEVGTVVLFDGAGAFKMSPISNFVGFVVPRPTEAQLNVDYYDHSGAWIGGFIAG